MSFNPEIQKHIDQFVAELSELVRKQALEALEQSFGGAAGAQRSGGRRAARTASAAPAPERSGKRIKRTADQLAKVEQSILDFVKANPGLRIEAISPQLRLTTKELQRPMKNLVSSGQIATEGQRRATTYHPGTGSRGRRKK